ncbi:aspartyl protease family protein 1 [Elaeis guineensis]|uniref:Aspartyl protease family protein 1 n=1 Tax=Elaeis guineensis var. tenera TaxID=51953 RepID=A0A6I9RZG5_ELAGV|nr:aspartyl protease family protein 1 [Elaeis guineensis]
MASSSPSLRPLLLFAAVALAVSGTAGGATLGLDFHHRFSDRVRQWAEAHGGLPGGWWPKKGSVEYYAALARHDRALRGRALADGGDPDKDLVFADGNVTFRHSSLGFLHYAIVALGTPNVTFLVALDTGSDLFWVPCNCISCAPTSSRYYGLRTNFEFNIYSPTKSSTSRKVPCNSSFCELKSSCSAATGSCPYVVQYVSYNTSSTGVLVEDILYFKTEETIPKVVKAPIVFGCGQIQTGAFLDGAAPNGLFGLGLDNVSVPSVLASKGYTSDSFSMCFGSDGIGRIYFGDKGSSDQEETPFDVNHGHPTYNISFTGLEVRNSSVDVKFSAIVDSGTSFTYLADPEYTKLTESFDTQVQENRLKSDPDIPFEYCYELSPNQGSIIPPKIILTTKGGSQFPINDPIVVLSNQQRLFAYCLAIIKSHRLNIIGQNFMTGLRIVFDRERLILGWKEFDCYDAEGSSTLPVNRNQSAIPPSPASGPSSYTPDTTKERGNNTQATVLPPPSSHSSHLNSMESIFWTLIVFSLAIL